MPMGCRDRAACIWATGRRALTADRGGAVGRHSGLGDSVIVAPLGGQDRFGSATEHLLLADRVHCQTNGTGMLQFSSRIRKIYRG